VQVELALLAGGVLEDEEGRPGVAVEQLLGRGEHRGERAVGELAARAEQGVEVVVVVHTLLLPGQYYQSILPG
jgi:hypothetical protein